MKDSICDDNEISLKVYAAIIKKRKVIIFSTFILFLIIAATTYFKDRKFISYEISMSIKPCYIYVGEEAEPYLYGYDDIKKITKNPDFIRKIERVMNLRRESLDGMFIVAVTSGLDLVEVGLPWKEENRVFGFKLMNSVFNEIAKDFQKRVDLENIKIEETLSLVENRINLKKEVISPLRTLSAQTDESIKELQAELKKLQREVSNKKNHVFFLNKTNLEKKLSSFNELNQKIDELIRVKYQSTSSLKNLLLEVQNLQSLVRRLKLNKNNSSEIKLVQQPYLLMIKGKPKRLQKFFSVALTGLLLGLIIAFLQESRIKF